MGDQVFASVADWKAAGSPLPATISAESTGTYWKPDFTKTDPWMGMPADYAGVATFVPVAETPVPPWTGQIGSEAIPIFGSPEYEVVVQEIVAAAVVTAQTGTALEKERAAMIRAAAEKAEVARQEIFPQPETVEKLEEPGKIPWLPIGIAVGAILLFRK